MIGRPALSLALVLASVGVAAQQRPSRPPVAAPAPQPPPPPPAPVYEPMLLRLAEILGALAHLSELCAPPGVDSEIYRARMRDLIDAEGQNEAMRDRLAGSFNRGLVGYQASHVACTPASRLAMDRLIAEGTRLAQDIAARFGS